MLIAFYTVERASPVFFIFFVSFLTAMILIASESEKSSRKLAVTVSLLISEKGSLLTETERPSAASYLNNIQTNALTARPCELYDINNSLLLQIFGTIVTYTIIILQSAWWTKFKGLCYFIQETT